MVIRFATLATAGDNYLAVPQKRRVASARIGCGKTRAIALETMD
jgi:hypothetical protein